MALPRQQVAVAGRVIEAGTGRPLGGAHVRIEGPGGAAAGESITPASGLFSFVDLPDGRYELQVSIPGCGRRCGTAKKQIRISRDRGGNVRTASVDVELTTPGIETPPARRQLAVGGRVLDVISGRPLAGARVRVAAAAARLTREAVTTATGAFCFLDLPDGRYELEAYAPAAGRRRGRTRREILISRGASGNLQTVFADLRLPATALRGTVTRAGGEERVALAEVRVRGSGEHTFTDSEGNYVLREIEYGKRAVQVFAPGYKPASERVVISKAGAEARLDFVLTPTQGLPLPSPPTERREEDHA